VLDADGYRQSITNSLIFSGIGAILVAAIAVAAERSTFRFSKTIEYLALGAPRYEAAAALEQAALAELRERRPDRAIETNVEFWAAVILDFAEVPTLMMPAMFTGGRTAGWCAHILEQKRLGKLIRPAAIYTGPAPRSPESVEGWDHIAPTP
jgi:citrate synthase